MQGFQSPELDRSSQVPLYRQVERFLRRRIERGQFSPGEMLPSVKALCREFGGLNHLTVRQAIRHLIEDGLVESVKGRGTFVRGVKARAGRIALVLPSLNDALTTRIAQGVQSVLGENGIRTIVMDSRAHPEEELENIRQLEDLPLDGAIIFPFEFGDIFEEIYRLKVDRFPFVLIDRYFYDTDVFSVVVDNYKGAFEMTTHLIERGKRRLAWIGGLGFSSAQDRFRGFCDALNEAGLSYKRAWVEEENDPRKAVARLLKAKPRPDGIVFLNDFGALEGMQAIQDAGLTVPGDIGVTGFDDIDEAARAVPPLTTVRQPMDQLGVEAARLLLEVLEKRDAAPRRIILPVEAVVRKST